MSTARNIGLFMHTINKEEQNLTAGLAISHRIFDLRIKNHLIIIYVLILKLFAGDLDGCVFFRSRDGPDEDLVGGGDHLVESELNIPNMIMLIKSLQVIKVVYIVNGRFENLLLLEFIGDVEALDPFWAQIVHNNLGHPNQGPHIPSLLLEDHHAVGPGERVKIR